MSAEPPSSSGSSGRHRPIASELSRETTEDDLWNLDDESPPVSLPAPKQPPAKRPAAESPPEGKPDGPAGGEPDREKREIPEDTSPAKPVRVRPIRLEPKSWSGEKPAGTDEIGDLSEPDEIKAEVSTPPFRPDSDKPPVEAPPAPKPEVPKEAKPVPARESRPKRTAQRPRLNRRELMGLAAFAFVLMVAVIWVLTRFFGQIPIKADAVGTPDYPVKGDHASLAGAETFWRQPIREGADRDVARREVRMIPVLEVSLDPADSRAGALRVVFRDGNGDPIGDTITRSFTAGSFDASGSPTVAFPATDGFVEEGDFNAYRAGDDGAWVAEISEGPSVNAPASSFKILTPVPVLPLRR